MSAVAPPGTGELTKEQLLEAYRVMRTIREFEERLHGEFATGEIPGFVHLYAGEEAIAAGVMRATSRDDDYVASHAPRPRPRIAKGCDVKGMMAEIFGKPTGHLPRQGRLDAHRRPRPGHARRERHRRRRPAARLRRRPDREGHAAPTRSASSFIGDGGSNQGTFLESAEPRGASGTSPSSSSSRTTATPRRPSSALPPGRHRRGQARRRLRHARRRWSTASTSSPSTRRPARRSSARAPAAGRPSLECKVVPLLRPFRGRRADLPRRRTRSRTLRRDRDCLDRFARRVTDGGLGRAAERSTRSTTSVATLDRRGRRARPRPRPSRPRPTCSPTSTSTY